MTYKIEKFDHHYNIWVDFGGGYTEEDVKRIVKGYKFDGLFYSRSNSRSFFVVSEEV